MSEIADDPIIISLNGIDESQRTELVDEFFTGPMLEWAGKRYAAWRDYIMPKIIYIEQVGGEEHKVAWVEHIGMNTATYDVFHNHHVVCDCVLCKNFNGADGAIDTSQCEVMEHALEYRAESVRAPFMPAIHATEEGAVNVLTGASETATPFDLESLSITALEQVLRADSVQPESWQGNAVSGVFTLEEAGRILDQPLSSTVRYAELLQRKGKVQFDGGEMRYAA